MDELRVDPLSGLRVLVAAADDDHSEPVTTTEPVTAPEPVAAGLVTDPAALHRPALSPDAVGPPREASLDLFTSAAARGRHEVVTNTTRPVTTLGALAADELQATMGRWRERMAVHLDASHVHLHVDERAGDPRRSHAQLWALDFVPAAVARERERSSAYATRTQGSDLLGDLVGAEVRLRERLVAYDDEAVLLAPYASRVPYQLMVVPRTPAPRFEEPGALGAGMLHRALRVLAGRFGGSPPLTLWVRTAPRGADHFCWRIDVLPLRAEPGGLELGTGVPVNPVPPERAAAELRPLAG